MMPYVVTRRQPGRPDDELPAVATLEEARLVAAEITLPYALAVQPPADKAYAAACGAIPESGGTIGPLPDGTVIEAESVIWTELADRADCFPVPWSHERILAAYNARRSGTAVR